MAPVTKAASSPASQTTAAATAQASARQIAAQRDVLRSRALRLFDDHHWDEGEAAWAEVDTMREREEHEYRSAAEHLDSVLLLDPQRRDLREQVADLTFERGRAWRIPKPLNSSAMHAAAQRLTGRHDFTTFRHSECQAKSPVKTLDQLDVHRIKDDIHVMAAARSFLHSQVRSMVGSLVWVGEGRWSADDLAAALAARNRAACGPVAPPEGLYLVRVEY